MMRFLILSVALGSVLTLNSAAWAQTSDPDTPLKAQKKATERTAQQATEQVTQAKKALEAMAQDVDKSQKEKASLESLLAQALKNNPDIRVAESKVREAEAELNRVRM